VAFSGPSADTGTASGSAKVITIQVQEEKMSTKPFPVGLKMDVSYPNFQVSLTLMSTSQLKFEIKEAR
jgi:hypothetical protein